MEIIQVIIDFIIHIDEHLISIVANYGTWTYAILFLIIFAETGLVVTPFLPGDSLLFAAGAIAATGVINPFILFLLLFIAAVLGDFVNYSVGSYLGLKIFKEDAKVFKTSYLEKTQVFFDKYGGKTIVVARFVPIVRTYAPFVAGAGSMNYSKFLFYNVFGGALWTSLFLAAGYLFGNLPFVKNNFSLVVFVIIGVSVLPIVWEFAKKVFAKQQTKKVV